ncbi:MAG: MFS transporter, partial [Chloroflexota bacterium]
GSLIYTTFVTRLPRRKTFTLCFLLIGFYPLLLSTPLPPLLLLIGFTIMGLFASPLNPIIQSVMYERVPQNMRGRVFGLTTSGVQIAMPFGALIAGYAVEIAGLPFTVIGFSIVSIFAVFTLTVNPAMKDMANQPVAASGNVEL